VGQEGWRQHPVEERHRMKKTLIGIATAVVAAIGGYYGF
jgi:hypothetical protein